MKLPVISINTILGIIITIMGSLALLLAILSGSIHRDLVFKNQKIMMKEMIKITANESIKHLNNVSRDLGLALQRTKKFNQLFNENNEKEMLALLNNQFHQYFVTAGIIDLKQLVVFDKSFSFLVESTEGAVLFKKTPLFCPDVMNEVRSREGLHRIKIFTGLCLFENKPINIVVAPVGGLRLKGYIMIITDPSHNLAVIEVNLGLPLKLNFVNNQTVFKSLKWPDDESEALISDFSLSTSSGVRILSILTAQNISTLTSSLQKARIEVLLITGIVTLLFIAFSIYVLQKYMLKPLGRLSYELRYFGVGQSDGPKKIELQGSKEIHKLCEGFNYMASAQFNAQESDHQKSQFLANMSHEIRTPLSAIIGFSETLYKNENNKEKRDYIERIIRNGKHLHQLIDDILDSSKIEANQLTIENIEVSLCDLVMDVDSLMAEKASSKGLGFNVIFEFPVPKFITTDPTRLKQVLINLCDNAIKFTEKGGVILTVGFERKNKRVKFSIKDTGIGMSTEQIVGLFKPFKQADSSTTRKYGGTGLGLYISKLLSEKLGGKLNVSSISGEGSLFEVDIDAGDIGETWVNSKEDIMLAEKTKVILTPNLKGKVLLAEDSIDNQMLISLYVENTGATIDVVSNGKLAVEKGLSETYDLILMDMQMPVMGGIEAISNLRKLNCTTPIVVLTANAMKEAQLKSEQAGASGFMTKPINQDIFYDVLRKHLSHAGDESHGVTFDREQSDKMESLFKTFVSQLPKTSDIFEMALEKNEWESLSFELHKLKGTSSTFGLQNITELCAEIEEKIKSSDFNFAKELTVLLIKLLRENILEADS